MEGWTGRLLVGVRRVLPRVRRPRHQGSGRVLGPRQSAQVCINGKHIFTAKFLPQFFQISANPEWTAIPVSAMTAVGALELVGHIKQGQNVLVTAAAGKSITHI